MSPIPLSLDQRPRASIFAGEERGVFDEETACRGGVGVERDFELAEEREEVGFDMAGYGVVVALVDGGDRVRLVCANVVYLLDVFWFEVGEAELGSVLDGGYAGVGETYMFKPAYFVDGVDGLK
jgi:hypothetical protein